MPEFVELYWPYLVIGALVAIALIWFLLAANRKTSVISEDKKDVLDEGAAPAARNQALIDAPVAAEAEPAPAAEPATGSRSGGDDLTVIKGLGPKIAIMLNEMGITQFSQIAAWDDSDIDRVDAQLDRFSGRIRRDNWVEQAKLLSSNDESAFASKFGQNG